MAVRTPTREQDQKLEVAMGKLLRLGVLLAAAVVLLGAGLYLRHADANVPDYRTFHGTAAPLRSISGIFTGVAHLDSASVIQFGMLLLIATPVARVVFALVGFSVERDWFYTLVSAVVLAILAFSLLHGT